MTRSRPPSESRIAVGTNHSCAIRSGRVYCWGANDHGQLGDGTADRSSVPRLVSQLDTVVAIHAAGDYTCALSDRGAVFCWGELTTRHHDLVDNIGERWTRPQHIPTAGVTSRIAVGLGHACALDDQGAASCWGKNTVGQLGDGTGHASLKPVRVATAVRFAEIVAGDTGSCARTADGRWFCWGRRPDNYRLLLSPNAGSDSLRPVEVPAARDQLLSFGQHVCVGQPKGLVQCDSGLSFDVGVVKKLVTGGPYERTTVCVLRAEGTVLCAGSNADGQAGARYPAIIERPFVLPELTAVADIALGKQHGCAMLHSGSVLCWGANTAGQRGTGRIGESVVTPRVVSFDHEPVARIDDAACLESQGTICGISQVAKGKTQLCYCAGDTLPSVRDREPVVRCFHIDEQSTAGTAVSAPSSPPQLPPDTDPSTINVHAEYDRVTICTAPSRCRVVRPALPNDLLHVGTPSVLDVAVTADGTNVTVGRIRRNSVKSVEEVGRVANIDAETYDVVSGKRLVQFVLPGENPIESVTDSVFRSMGKSVEVLGAELRDPRTGKLLRKLDTGLQRIHIGADRWLFVGTGGATMWIAEDGRSFSQSPPFADRQPPHPAAVRVGEQVIVAAGARIRSFDAATGQLKHETRLPWCRPANDARRNN